MRVGRHAVPDDPYRPRPAWGNLVVVALILVGVGIVAWFAFGPGRTSEESRLMDRVDGGLPAGSRLQRRTVMDHSEERVYLAPASATEVTADLSAWARRKHGKGYTKYPEGNRTYWEFSFTSGRSWFSRFPGRWYCSGGQEISLDYRSQSRRPTSVTMRSHCVD